MQTTGNFTEITVVEQNMSGSDHLIRRVFFADETIKLHTHIYIYIYIYIYINFFRLPPPEDAEAFARFGHQELYDNLTAQWQSLLPPDLKIDESAKIAGCYSLLIKPGFRIISVNTNFCYKLNW